MDWFPSRVEPRKLANSTDPHRRSRTHHPEAANPAHRHQRLEKEQPDPRRETGCPKNT